MAESDKNSTFGEYLLAASGICIIILSLLFFIGVILRYILRISFGELQILIRICISWSVFLSGVAAFESRKHLTLDVIDPRSLKSPWLRTLLSVIINSAILFILIALLVSSFNSFSDSLRKIEPINRKFNQSYFYLPFFVGSILLLCIHLNKIFIKPLHSKLRVYLNKDKI